ncbi:MAG: hypothetical protein NTV80_08630 [Verrucomicrobia bacterium]|nr:hypothetical protein [Verrucomicrobiota bacterium]
MIENFTIKDSIYLVSGEDTLDLHNNYDMTEITYSVAERRATLTWVRSTGDWVPATEPLQLRIEFHGVSCFRFMPRDPQLPFTEDNCLSNAGYWTDEDWCDRVMICEADPEPHWLRAFQFQSGAIVAIAADEAKAIIRR